MFQNVPLFLFRLWLSAVGEVARKNKKPSAKAFVGAYANGF